MKNIQLKTTVVLLVVSSILLSGVSLINIYNINNISKNINSSEIMQVIARSKSTLELVWVISIILFSIFSIIFINNILKVITKPLSNIVDNAGKFGDDNEIKYLEEAKKSTDDKFSKTINSMTEELRQNLDSVNKQKNQTEAILLHIKDGIISVDLNGNVTYINPAAINFFDLTQDDNTFDKIFKKIGLDVNLEKIVYLDDLTSSEQKVFINEKYINIFFAPVKDSKKIPNGIIILLQDITEHVKLDNMRKEFVADVSHELKTPITSILGYTETLLEGDYDKETQVKFLNVIESESHRMAKLVSDLLTLSRYDNNKNKTEITDIDLGDLTKKCLEKLKVEIEKKQHKIECFVTAEVPLVKVDKYGIERVILNILTNAIKYTPENGNIKIYVGFVYNDAYIKVIDNGIGIPEKDLPRVFERFYRVEKARAREMGGTGLGLAIAKEIIEQNNGSINIKSVQGKGTEVVIRIPAKSKESVENNE
ncbi:MAG TPA: cell wall metabolism sensor histidine kinase WalK [Clostridiaceae bacterium]|nr:cell wall metabolism sensor histidine kinase WalK [Clostridiaceae bacterium]